METISYFEQRMNNHDKVSAIIEDLILAFTTLN